MSAAPINITSVLDDPQMFGGAFPADTFYRRRVLLKASFGEALSDDEMEIFTHHTGRTERPTEPFREIVEIGGRRIAKTRSTSFQATVLATCVDYSPFISAGEVVTVALIAADRKQAQIAKNYILGFIRRSPMLASLLDGEPTVDTISLTTGVRIEIMTASTSAPRGRTFAAVICDEIAHWRGSDELSNPAAEILRAIRPGLSTIPTSKLIIISSPHAKAGPLYNASRKHFGVNSSPVLVWRGATLEMNPTFPAADVAAAMEEDPESAKCEYLGLFRDDISAYINADLVHDLVVKNRIALPPASGVVYSAFSDAAGGSGGDSYTTAISHREANGMIVIDAVLETRSPFSPEVATAEHAEFIKSFSLRRTVGDHYAGLWPRDRLLAHGVEFSQSAKPKSELYLEFVTLLNSRKVELLDNKRLTGQLIALERRTGRSGRDTVDHPAAAGAHDDVINAVCGSALLSHHLTDNTPLIVAPITFALGSFDPTPSSVHGQHF